MLTKMKVAVTSEHTIKPSTPTPNHHRNFPLSSLDQVQPPAFLPLVYFYQSPPATSPLLAGGGAAGELLGTLRNSLSETLTWYYPLAGRMKENMFVDCDDEGVPFFEAQVVDCKLRGVVEERNYEDTDKLFPPTEKVGDAGVLPLAIQINLFSCGGVAIGVLMSHKIADAQTLVMFMKFWATLARGDRQSLVFPQFGLAKIFPPIPMTTHFKAVGDVNDTKIITRSFSFRSHTISALKSRYGSGHGNHQARISGVEAVTAFISSVLRKNISLFIVQTVDLRRILDPPLPDSFVGNVSQIAGTFISEYNKKSTGNNRDGGGYEIIARTRESLKSIDGEHVKRLQESNGNSNLKEDTGPKIESPPTIIALTLKDLSTLPHYETDFGWGKPSWVTIKTLDLDHLVTFMSAESSDDVEVVFNMKETDMMKLESDKEFRKVASISSPKASVPSSL